VLSLSIRLRLVLTLVLVIGAGGVTEVASYLMQGADTAALQARSQDLLKLRDLAHELEEVVGEQHDAILTYLVAGNLDAVAAYQGARIEQAQLMGASEALVAGHAELREALQGIEQATQTWRDKFAEPAIELMQTGREDAARSAGRLANGEAVYGTVLDADLALDDRLVALSIQNIAAMEHIEANQIDMLVIGIVASLLGILLSITLVRRWILRPVGVLLATAQQAEAGQDVRFPAASTDEIGRMGRALETMRMRLFGQAQEASIINRFTELTAFLEADGDVARATLDALAGIVAPDDGAIHISNHSRDRAVPEGSIGKVTPTMISQGQLGLCPGVRRGSRYLTSDLSDRLGVRCTVYPAITGTLACIPLVALGEVVGVVHLHWNVVDALPMDIRRSVTRITEHASLAIANRRLMTALQGMATTDGRTGLPNSRAFDEALESQLSNRDPGDQLSVLMLDIDQFKAFNDRNGHPAGDEALRTFALILRGCVRDDDVAARYGGEEFIVMLPGTRAADAMVVAERIRSRTAEAVIELGPGHRDQFTVSIGVATWPVDGSERVKLLSVADAALYRAKNAGRNRIVLAGQAFELREDDPQHDAPAAAMPPPVALPLAG
jgi:diguanylate cyclase (GGDEF)-like protein